MTENEIQVDAPYGPDDRAYYSLETPGGRRWSWDEEDLDEAYIEDTLWAWSRLLDFVRERNNANGNS